jgi:hypothetical protein
MFQTTTLFGYSLARIKSLCGEPSMFALMILPMWIYAMHMGRKKTSLLLFVSLFLSFSTTAYIGIVMYYIMKIGKKIRSTEIKFSIGKVVAVCFSIAGIALLFAFKGAEFKGYLDFIIFDKVTMQTESGIARTMYFKWHMDFFFEQNFLQQLFGVGFGTVRSTDLFSTLLVNTGLVGTSLFSTLFLYPVFKMKSNDKEASGIKIAVIVVFVAMMVSVSEIAQLTSWLILGMAYSRLRAERLSFILTNQNRKEITQNERMAKY